jgi:hypothetical protein
MMKFIGVLISILFFVPVVSAELQQVDLTIYGMD